MNSPEGIELRRDPYRAAVIALAALAFLGTAGAIAGGAYLANPVLLAVALLMGLSGGVLTGVATAQTIRSHPPKPLETTIVSAAPEEAPIAEPPAVETPTAETPTVETLAAKAAMVAALVRGRAIAARRKTLEWIHERGALRLIRLGTAVAGTLAVIFLLWVNVSGYPPNRIPSAIAAGLCLVAAGIAATAIRYLAAIDPAQFPESPALIKGARSVGWIFVLAAISVGLAWADLQTTVKVLFYIVLTVDAAICYGLFTVKTPKGTASNTFPLDIGVLSVLGERTNVLASILDSAEQQFGIDLRSTWALTVVRRSLEPLIMGLVLAGWLSTSLTVVGIEEQGLVERLGVPVGGEPLFAGLHVHLPWPIDKVFRIPVRRVQVLEVGHEGKEAPGPENVLWAVEHAPNEFTLLLGNGRDLITVDAGVQYRIVNAAAWRYNCQNPDQALSAIAYRAVMRNTVSLTLSDALSQNVALLTGRMRAMIQSEANNLNLGVEILGFTVGGMHPPVAVARDYQAVVSAELRKVTTVVNAQVYRGRLLPEAESTSVMGVNGALAEGAEALGKAAGEAWSFRTLQSQYRSSPGLFLFRRRLETLEKGLDGRDFTILDSRFQRDGGEVWVTP